LNANGEFLKGTQERKRGDKKQLSPSFLSSLPAEFKHIIKRRKRK
jgi:hypothetical protein